MKNELNDGFETQELSPFGLLVTTQTPDSLLSNIAPSQFKEWVAKHRLVLLRGFAPPEGEALTKLARSLGEVLEWSFGAVNDLKVKPEAQNYLYTPREVPFHWDGAFIGRIPHFILFHCAEAPDPNCGGETLFTDTVSLIENAPTERKALWESVEITYSTEKVVHYGGQFSSKLMGLHPTSGETVLRFAEPVEDLNPVHLDIPDIFEAGRIDLLNDLAVRLRDPMLCLAHQWQDNDVVLADNHALLHGRRAFSKETPRHIRRVNIL